MIVIGETKVIVIGETKSIIHDIQHYVLPISVELDRMFVGSMQDTNHSEGWLELYRLGREAQRRAGSKR